MNRSLIEQTEPVPDLYALDCHLCGVGIDFHEAGASLWFQAHGGPWARCQSCTDREQRVAVSFLLIRLARWNLTAQETTPVPGDAP